MLLISEDPREANTFMSALRACAVKRLWARPGAEGLAVVRGERPDLLLVDLEPTERAGPALLQALRAEHQALRFIVVGRRRTVSLGVTAIQFGAFGALEKPFNATHLILAVRSALGLTDDGFVANATNPANAPSGVTAASRERKASPRAPVTEPRPIADRWASLVLNVVRAERDPRTIHQWARLSGVSASVLCECCRLVHIRPSAARDFARLLHVVRHSGKTWQPDALLDLADARTLKRLLASAGMPPRMSVTPGIEEFLERQRWIPANNAGLIALRARLLGDQATPRMPAAVTPRRACATADPSRGS